MKFTMPDTSQTQRQYWLVYSFVGFLVCIGLWHFLLRDRVIVKRWGEVIRGKAYRSGQISRHLIKQTLQHYQIRRIICLTSPDESDPDLLAELQASAELGVEHIFLPMNGRGGGKVEHFTKAVDLLAQSTQQGHPVLVHCHAGAQRTGGVVAAYRLLIEQRGTDFVMEELKRYGWNSQRDQYLINYVNEHIHDAAMSLLAQGRITKLPNPLPHLPVHSTSG